MQKKILIVDENNEVRDLFHKSMSLLSYSLHYATDGFQAMHSYALHKHDLVILY